MRIQQHPILKIENIKKINFVFQDKQVTGYQGDTIASALHALGIRELSASILQKRPRGFYCAIGNCASCNMTVDNVPNVKTCLIELKAGMVIKKQKDKGVIK